MCSTVLLRSVKEKEILKPETVLPPWQNNMPKPLSYPVGMEPGTNGHILTMERRSVPTREQNARSIRSPSPGQLSAKQATKNAAIQAMQSLLDRLVRPEDRLITLFTPPFDKTPLDPGYIKGYLPGIRENGGQYTHAATWTAWAFAQLGDGKQAGELFNLLNPVFQSDSEEKASVYRVEPYVICADIYSAAPYVRRGGWTWYTGSAAWMYRLGLEAILGFKKIGNTLNIEPAIPPSWDGFEIRYQFGGSGYLIEVHNPEHVSHDILEILTDGQRLIGSSIPLIDDKQEHRVVVTMGEKHK